MSFSTSLLQRCRQLSNTLSSSSVMWRGAGCMGRSGGSRDWVKGLWIGILCCWAAGGAAAGADTGPELSKGGSKSCSATLLLVRHRISQVNEKSRRKWSRGRQLTVLLNKTHLGRGGGCPVVPPGGAEESMSSTGEVHTGLLEANSMAYWSTSARGNLFGPEP